MSAAACSDSKSVADLLVEIVDEFPAKELPVDESAAEEPLPDGDCGRRGIGEPRPLKVQLRTGELVVGQTVLAAGLINFEASNFVDAVHIFAVARGDSYETLPKVSNGAVDGETLGDDFIVKTGILIEGLGNVRTVSVDLAPGTCVLYCNGGDDEDEVAHPSVGEAVTISVTE